MHILKVFDAIVDKSKVVYGVTEEAKNEMVAPNKRNLQLAGKQACIEASGAGDPAQLAAYISDVTLELRNLAKNANLTFLSYLLEMAFQEAFDITQKRHKMKGGSS